ncbi:hypothetical protein BGZ47_008763 [Haplosporangium gracile]|nr:hypothetical protein BGZ47_008763 [Haplosporangium gracile]
MALFARSESCNMLYKQIPSNKIHFSKKIVSFEQDQNEVTVTFDDTTTRGDILVGADSVHSAFHNYLYKTLDNQGLLPKADTLAMNKGYISLVGTIDPVQYPYLLAEDSVSYAIIGDKNTPYTWVTFTVPVNKVCWNIVIQLGISSTADEHAGSSDWTVQANKEMLDEIRHFKATYGTLGDLFDVTRSRKSPRCILRTSCLRPGTMDILPSSVAGAVNAMVNAVVLANHIYDIKPTNFENIKTALSGYKEERFEAAKDLYPQSYMSVKLLYGHALKRGTMETIPQRPSKRIQKEQEDGEARKKGASPLLPSTEVRAVNTMQDTVLLANHIYDIHPTSFEWIKEALDEYKDERFDVIKDQYP